jgi:DNA-binding LacI/PurR family transcriptional regulator
MTIYDISKKTGYSIATVSKVLNNYHGVSDKAKQVINQVIEETGYTPSHYARTLATQRSWLIGVLFSEEKGLGIVHPHFNKMLQSFQLHIGKYGYDTIFLNDTYGEKQMTLYDKCKSRGVDGVIIAGSMRFSEAIESVLESDLPKVSIETIYPNVRTIISDNRMGTMQALEHLYLLGHRKIAHIASNLIGSMSAKERYDAYIEFMKKKGLEIRPDFIVEANKYNEESGEQAIRQLLSQCWEDMPTAIFAAYDEYVAAAMEIFTSQGFSIPEDISIVGFDDLPLCEYVKPSITTVHQNRDIIGKEAARILSSLIAGEEAAEPEVLRIPTNLVVRHTTKKLAHN